MRDGVNGKLERWQETLETKGFKLSRMEQNIWIEFSGA